MALNIMHPTSPGSRHHTGLPRQRLTVSKPVKSLTIAKSKITGRNNSGKITIRHRGGGEKRRLRLIDFKRDKYGVPGLVTTIEYDPNRTSDIALITYADGDKRYILAPFGLKLGMAIMAGETADLKVGNALPLKQIPVGTPIHNIELHPGKGGQMIKSAGSSALIQSKEGQFATILLPSKEIRLVHLDCYATIGQVSNPEWKTISLGKAGRKRHMGRRPEVRGTAQQPNSHPHGGGEGRSGVGLKQPKTPWGKPARGKLTRSKKKYSNRYIIRNRRQKGR
jgi:large subunit ribosomal protein L2